MIDEQPNDSRTDEANASAGGLIPLVYDELRRIAGRYLRNERAAVTLQATMLVHEAYIRLAGDKVRPWKNRAHFAAIAAIAMRRILVERGRARATAKRGNAPILLTLDDQVVAEAGPAVDLLALDQALSKLAELDPRPAQVVELRFFGGLTIEETADTLDLSPATVKRHWTMARAWLKRELGVSASDGT